MADQEKNNEEKPQGEKSSKKTIIIIAIVVILSIGLSVGATFYFLNSSGDSGEATENTPVEDVKLPAVYLDIKPPFVVTYDVDGRQRYMQVFVSAQGRDQESLDMMELHMPLIRNKIIVYFSGQDFATLQTPEGKQSLREGSLTLINEMLEKESPGSSIEQVLFTNFVMQ